MGFKNTSRRVSTMESLYKIASYICQRYKAEFGECISEMKLHKLLYFMQRESIIRFGEPPFEDRFEAWRYGPVIPVVREMYASNILNENTDISLEKKYNELFDYVFKTYAVKDARSLSRLTHGEVSWINARKNLSPSQNGKNQISIQDIEKDAYRIKVKRLVKELVK